MAGEALESLVRCTTQLAAQLEAPAAHCARRRLCGLWLWQCNPSPRGWRLLEGDRVIHSQVFETGLVAGELEQFEQQQPGVSPFSLPYLRAPCEFLDKEVDASQTDRDALRSQFIEQAQQQGAAGVSHTAQAADIDAHGAAAARQRGDLAQLGFSLGGETAGEIDGGRTIARGATRRCGKIHPRWRRTLEARRVVKHTGLKALTLPGEAIEVEQHHPQAFTGCRLRVVQGRGEHFLGLANIAIGIEHGRFLEHRADARHCLPHLDLARRCRQASPCIAAAEVELGEFRRRREQRTFTHFSRRTMLYRFDAAW